MFKTITAYDIHPREKELMFKAINWRGVEEVFILREYQALKGEHYVYEVTEGGKSVADYKWINVDIFSCRVGAYMYLPYLLLFLLMVVNFLAMLKFLWRIGFK